jgi:hypothetical protein
MCEKSVNNQGVSFLKNQKSKPGAPRASRQRVSARRIVVNNPDFLNPLLLSLFSGKSVTTGFRMTGGCRLIGPAAEPNNRAPLPLTTAHG